MGAIDVDVNSDNGIEWDLVALLGSAELAGLDVPEGCISFLPEEVERARGELGVCVNVTAVAVLRVGWEYWWDGSENDFAHIARCERLRDALAEGHPAVIAGECRGYVD